MKLALSSAVGLASGATLALTAPPTNLHFAPFVGLAGLAWALRETARGPGRAVARAALVGAAFGTGANLVALRFVPEVIQRFTELGAGLSYLALALLAPAQALGWLLAGVLAAILQRRGGPPPLATATGVFAGTFFPALFPWTPAGGISPWPILLQLADVIGERGVTFLMAFACAGAVEAVMLRAAARTRGMAWLALTGLVGAAAVAYGAARIDQIDRRRAAAPHLRIGLLQPGFEARQRWEPARAQPILDNLVRLTRFAEAKGAEIVIWPESAYPYAISHAMRHDPVGELAIRGEGVRGPVMTGIYMVAGHGSAFNSAAIAYPDGTLSEPYDKRHLLWFGETVPLADELPFLRRWFSRGTGILPGTKHVLLSWGRMRAGVLNCYEDTIGLAGREAQEGANLLVNVTNDAWFAGSAEGELHLYLSALRAIETRKDLVRAVNLGPTSFVDAAGRVRARYAEPMPAPLIVDAALLDGDPTFFARAGDVPMVLLIVAGVLARRRRALA